MMCEGVTEERYVKSMIRRLLCRPRRRGIKVTTAGKKSDPKSLVFEAHKIVKRARRDKVPYDSVWIILDNDNEPGLEKALQLCKEREFRVALSSIAIEHWFILHFEQCGRAHQNPEEAYRYLKRLWPDYHKTKLNHFDELYSHLGRALDNARQINKQSLSKDRHLRNPYTTIPDLVEWIDNL